MNPIIDFVRGIRSTDDYITLNPNTFNSMDIHLDMDALRDWALEALPFEASLEHTFKASVSNNGELSCTGGSVWMPNGKASISGVSNISCIDSNILYIELTSKSNGSLQYGTPSRTLSTGNSHEVRLPVCMTYSTGSGDDTTWFVRYYHIGDYAFTQLPYFWVEGYGRSKIQMLGHESNGDELKWYDVGECQE